MDDKKFVRGLFFKDRHEKTPNWVVLNVSVKPHDFYMWCQEHQDKMTKGWLNIVVKKSLKGTTYAEVDDWKPTLNQSTEPERSVDEIIEDKPSSFRPSANDPVEDIPF